MILWNIIHSSSVITYPCQGESGSRAYTRNTVGEAVVHPGYNASPLQSIMLISHIHTCQNDNSASFHQSFHGVHHFSSLLNIWFEISFWEWLCTEIRKLFFFIWCVKFLFFLSLFTFWQQALCEDCGKVSFPDEVMHPNPSFTFSVSHTHMIGIWHDMTKKCVWVDRGWLTVNQVYNKILAVECMLVSVEKNKWSWVGNARSDVTVSTAPFFF